MDMTPQTWPEWYDGRHINEVLFCQQFLDKHPMKCVRGRLFTVDGLIEDEGQISGKARENMETVKRSSNNVIEFLQSEGYIRFKADSEASSKALYEAYQRWCEDNAQKTMSANRLSSELAQNERLYNVEATNNVHVGGKRVRGFVGIEVVNPLPY